jgi:ribonuclease R
MTDRELLRRIERSPGQRVGYKQLIRELGLGGGRERRLLLEHLARLTAAGRLIKLDREQWAIPSAAESRNNLAAGRLDLHRDGFGFVRPEVRQPSGQDDIFIPPDAIHGAMQGDQVLVELAPPRNDGRRLGRIVRILTRKNPTVVGIFHYGNNSHFRREQTNFVRPFDARMSQPILIPIGEEKPATKLTPHRVLGEEARHSYQDLEGLVVDVEITDWPTPTKPARGRVIEVIGHPDDFGVDVEMMIRKHHLPRIFPDDVLTEASERAHLDPGEANLRRDFRALPIVTIDGETARDFDDAVLIREHRDGSYELQVHIADVSHYVLPGSMLDLEARLRGTSVYFPDRAIPMLPHELSSGICSLKPQEERLVLSCLMEISPEGAIKGYEIVEGVIRSAARMTYAQVHRILEGDAETRAEFEALVPEFERMKELALKLNARRTRRGSIDFDLPEPIIEFDEFGAMKSVSRSERNWAHRLIEEFMLAANECVATWIEDLGVPSIYRIHEKPDPRRVMDFEEIAAAFGYSLGIGALPVKRMHLRAERREQRGSGRNPRQHEIPEDIPVTPRMYQKLTDRIAGKPEERILSHLMLRSLRQARYSEKNEGHFALAAPSYTHFTSPIRRYPDLIVHRIAKVLLQQGISGTGRVDDTRHASPWTHVHEGVSAPPRRNKATVAEQPPIEEGELEAIAEETSHTERRAAEAERELVEWKKIKFMQDRVGEDFPAMILNPTKYGLFVELDDLFVEGLVPIDSMRADRYTYRENTRQVIGDFSDRIYSAGDRVQVILDRVDAVDRRLQFSLLEEEAFAPRKKKSGGTKSRRKEKAGKRAKNSTSAQQQKKGKGPFPPKGKKKRGKRPR